jgi:hypothetical protein
MNDKAISETEIVKIRISKPAPFGCVLEVAIEAGRTFGDALR